jgi:hypothetical protein
MSAASSSMARRAPDEPPIGARLSIEPLRADG